jgi:hypothetical protein
MLVREGVKAAVYNFLKWPQNNRLCQHPTCSKILEVRHISIFSVSAVLCSTDGYAPMIFAFPNLEARRKAAISLTSAFTAGQCIDHSRWGYPKFIG